MPLQMLLAVKKIPSLRGASLGLDGPSRGLLKQLVGVMLHICMDGPAARSASSARGLASETLLSKQRSSDNFLEKLNPSSALGFHARGSD